MTAHLELPTKQPEFNKFFKDSRDQDVIKLEISQSSFQDNMLDVEQDNIYLFKNNNEEGPTNPLDQNDNQSNLFEPQDEELNDVNDEINKMDIIDLSDAEEFVEMAKLPDPKTFYSKKVTYKPFFVPLPPLDLDKIAREEEEQKK